MSLLFGRQKRVADLAALQLAVYGRNRLSGKVGSIHVTPDTALRHSAVWACLRLRADLVSTMPIDVYRRVNGVQFEMPKPPVLVSPGGDRLLIQEWMYSTQFDLDRLGNTVGIITERDGQRLPKRIDLVSMDDVTVRGSFSEITEYRIRGKLYDPADIWHEKQFTVAGMPVGLSPIAYAAWSIGGYLSAQKFANDWFGNGAQHSGVLKNTMKPTLTAEESDVAKTRYREAVADRDIFVTGKDWEFAFANTAGTQASFIEEKQYGISDLARFLGVPGDMIDAATSKGSITYANVTQRNLQLLIMNIGPAIVRRESALSTILPQPRYVKLNTDAILRMDPLAVVESLTKQVEGRILAPSEAREVQNRQPFTPEQEAEFDRLFGARSAAVAPSAAASDPAVDALVRRLEAALERVAAQPAPVSEVHTHAHFAPPSPAQTHVDIRNEVAPTPVHVDVAPTPVEVRNDVQVLPAPVDVHPTPIEIRNEVAPTPIEIRNEVAPTPITVRNDVQPASVTWPNRRTTTEVERDKAGLIRKTTSTETDA